MFRIVEADRMKRIGNLWEKIANRENIEEADRKARKDKGYRREIEEHDLRKESDYDWLINAMNDGSFSCSEYRRKKIKDPKERILEIPPYFPDRVLDHALINVIGWIYERQLTSDTYSCIKGRGMSGAAKKVDRYMRDKAGTKYVLVEDVHHYYESIDHEILKSLNRRIIKDGRVLSLLDRIIDSTQGLPIGRFISQYLANYYLSEFDHWIKETKHVRYYVRYMDNLVIFGSSKKKLRETHYEIEKWMSDKRKLTLNRSWQVFEIARRKGEGRGWISSAWCGTGKGRCSENASRKTSCAKWRD